MSVLYPLSLQAGWFFLGFSVISLQTFINAMVSEVKPVAVLDWFDILGEGGAALFVTTWFVIVVESRPGGKVTYVLASGLIVLFIGLYQDALDEIFLIDRQLIPHGLIESVFLPVGMLLLTVGLYFWRGEQWVLSRQMQKRQRLFRQHETIDRITQLQDIAYLRKQLALLKKQGDAIASLCGHKKSKIAPNIAQKAGLVLLDIANFNKIQFNFGARESDCLLHALTELLLLNMRGNDLLCRYAGSQFAVLMPDTDDHETDEMLSDLKGVLEHATLRSFSGHKITLKLDVASACVSLCHADTLIERADKSLKVLRHKRADIENYRLQGCQAMGV